MLRLSLVLTSLLSFTDLTEDAAAPGPADAVTSFLEAAHDGDFERAATLLSLENPHPDDGPASRVA